MATTMEKTPRAWHINSPNWLIVLSLLWFALGAGILFTGLTGDATIEIEWKTESEYDTAGFNIFRSESPGGEFTQINPQLIPSQADPASGAAYLYSDENVEPGQTYYYILEDVEYNNTRERHDIIVGQARQFDWMQMVITAVSFVFGFGLLAAGVREIRRQ